MPALRRITLALIVGLVLTGTAASGPGGDAGVASSCLRWKLVPSPAEGDWNVLEAVAARSGDDAWAVGWDTSDTAELTYAQHWDGRGWMVVPTPNVPGYHPYGEQDYLLAVTIVGTADAWAVGWGVNDKGYDDPIAEHWDGASWSLVPIPPLGFGNSHLYGVDGTAPNDVWAVGARWLVGTPAGKAIILHWDGASWSVAHMPRFATYSSALYDVDVRTANDVWAVGRRSGLTTLPLVEHWDGRRWRLVRAPGRRGRGEYFHGAAAVSGHKVWAVGSLYPKYDIERRTLAGRWNGRSWSLMPTPNRRSLDNDLLAVDAVPGGGVWAVGMTSFVEATRRPIVQRWDGRRWRNGRMPPVRTGGLQGLDLLSRTDGWAVGAELYVDGDRGGYRPLTERLGRC